MRPKSPNGKTPRRWIISKDKGCLVANEVPRQMCDKAWHSTWVQTTYQWPYLKHLLTNARSSLVKMTRSASCFKPSCTPSTKTNRKVLVIIKHLPTPSKTRCLHQIFLKDGRAWGWISQSHSASWSALWHPTVKTLSCVRHVPSCATQQSEITCKIMRLWTLVLSQRKPWHSKAST